MPIYEFECSACKHIFERVMKIDEDHKELNCPECNASNPNKLVASCSFHSRERYEERLANRMASRTQNK